MSLNYNPGFYSPNFNISSNNQAVTRYDIDTDDISLLDTDDKMEDNPDTINDPAIFESTNYSPNFSNFSQPIAPPTVEDHTDMDKPGPDSDSLLKTNDTTPKKDSLDIEDLSDKSLKNYIPTSVMPYISESSFYGIPRLMEYPLTSKKNVLRAVKSLTKIRYTTDRSVLVENIEKCSKQFGVNFNTITLSESTQKIYGFEVPLDKRTKEQVVKEHLNINSLFYNHLFYSEDFGKSVRALKEFDLLNYFFPNFENFTFEARLHSSLGGLGFNKELYQALKIRFPITTDFKNPIGFYNFKDYEEDLRLMVEVNYDPKANWFECDLSKDYVHIFYCLMLYSILGEIMNDPDYNEENLNQDQVSTLINFWFQMVCYHYDKYQEAKPYSLEAIKEAQYLHDLFWNFNDNPYASGDQLKSMLSMIRNMASVNDVVVNMNESGELVSKEDCTAYFIHDLELNDDMYLLPATLEYPIINKDSIRMAMDLINQVQPDDIKTFSKNLNRKYIEFGCTFSINIDHPYAKYANQNIIDHMTHFLHEGETAVEDQGTAGNVGTALPWFLRIDSDDRSFDFLPSKELGANDKPMQKPEITRPTSVN